jgi:hypothetical protein
VLGCGRCWEVGWEVGRLVAVGVLSGRWEDGGGGSAGGWNGYFLAPQVWRGPITYREESSLAVGKLRRQVKREFLMGVTTLTKGKRDSLVPKGDGVRGVFARGEGVLESECMC